jgi:hypothetical protein
MVYHNQNYWVFGLFHNPVFYELENTTCSVSPYVMIIIVVFHGVKYKLYQHNRMHSLKIRKHDVSETGSVSVHRCVWGGGSFKQS